MELETIEKFTQSRFKVKISRMDKSVKSFAEDVREGLSTTPKFLPPKYFYDAEGSRLFEQICELPEYYVTRTEQAILEKHADEIVQHLPEEGSLIELGSGSSRKTRVLIEALLKKADSIHYMPVDISQTMVIDTSKVLINEYPELHITALVSDYFTALQYLRFENLSGKSIIFLGSNIGNFDLDEALQFLRKVCEAMQKQDKFLLGTDMQKEREILEAAYDDAQGITAHFNLNVLKRINRELGGNFDLNKFVHRAFYNTSLHRIEMHLQSLDNQTVYIEALNQTFRFKKDETIHTENSYKYSMDQIYRLADQAGLQVCESWFDEKRWFGLHLLEIKQ